MPNFTFQIKEVKIRNYNFKPGKGWGRLIFTDGTCAFDQGFETRSQEVIEIIAANKGHDVVFKIISGSITQNNGYGEHKGKVYNNYVVDQIEVLK